MEEGADLFASFPQVDLDLIDGSYRKIDFSSTKVQLSNRAIQNWNGLCLVVRSPSMVVSKQRLAFA